MKKRCIVNVATGNYVRFQHRLMATLTGVGCDDVRLFWSDSYPAGSPTHQEDPYAFKLFAIEEAIEHGYTSIIWVDTSVEFLKPLEPLWEEIEREGHFMIIGGDKLFNWTNDGVLNAFGMTRDELQEKQWQLIGGTIYGFDVTNPRTREFLDEWFKLFRQGMFRGSYINEGANIDGAKSLTKNSGPKPVGKVSDDPRCWGHRHDETVGSFLAYKLNMKLSFLGGLFLGGQRGTNPNAVAQSGY